MNTNKNSVTLGRNSLHIQILCAFDKSNGICIDSKITFHFCFQSWTEIFFSRLLIDFLRKQQWSITLQDYTELMSWREMSKKLFVSIFFNFYFRFLCREVPCMKPWDKILFLHFILFFTDLKPWQQRFCDIWLITPSWLGFSISSISEDIWNSSCPATPIAPSSVEISLSKTSTNIQIKIISYFG